MTDGGQLLAAGAPATAVSGGSAAAIARGTAFRTPVPRGASSGLDSLAARVAGASVAPATDPVTSVTWASSSNPSRAGLDQLASRVATGAPVRSGATPRSSSANTSGNVLRWISIGVSLVGIVLVIIGSYDLNTTEISTNLLTGQTTTSSPDLGTGIVLILLGVALPTGVWLAAKAGLLDSFSDGSGRSR